MSNKLKQIATDARLAWHSLFFGLKAADDIVEGQVHGGGDGTEINQQVKPGGVFADMLEQKVTKEVEEMRDKYYRVLREADKYKPGDSLKIVYDDKGEMSFVGSVEKKTKEDFMKHAPVYETPDTQLFVIQENKHYAKKTNFEEWVPEGLYDYDTTIDIERDFIPRFEIEKFVKRVVVRKGTSEDHSFVDLYLPAEASQFGKIDAILISNLYTIYNEKNFRSDIIDFDKIKWNADNAWNCSGDAFYFEYDDPRPVDINIFDGNFVITFDCHIIAEKQDLAKKYETDDLTKKYEEEAPKFTDDGKNLDLFTISRHIKRMENKQEKKNEINLENIDGTTIKIS